MLCCIAQVSRNGYYKYLKASAKVDSDERLSCAIRDLQGTKWEMGYRPMTHLVNNLLGVAVNRKRILRIMREYGLLARIRRLRFPRDYYTAIKENREQLPRNVLNRDIAVAEPRKVFVCDITYIPCRGGWRFLHAVKDVFNKEIVAHRMSAHPDTRLCTDTIEDLAAVMDLSGVLIHSDQGSTYTSKAYRKLLSDLGVVQSMSRRGNCWDNASCESFFSTLKCGAFYGSMGKAEFSKGRLPAQEVISRVETYIDYYNTQRIQEGLEWMSPAAYLERNACGTLPMVITKSKPADSAVYQQPA